MTVDLDETDDEAPAKKTKVAKEDEESEDEFAADREEASDEDDEDVEEEDDEEDDEDEEDEEEGSEAELPSDLSEDEGPDTLEGLDSFVDELDAADRKKRDMKAVKAEVGKTKRRVLPVSSGPQASSKFITLCKWHRANIRWQTRLVYTYRVPPFIIWRFRFTPFQGRQQIFFIHLETRCPPSSITHYRPRSTRSRSSI
jgi:hypothetical protein